MSKHLTYRSKNPALNPSTFSNTISSDSLGSMTIQGTVDKTAIALSILLVGGYFGFTSYSPILIGAGFIFGFIIAIITIYKKHLAPYTVPIYCVMEGLALGGISFMYQTVYGDGIVLQAISLTIFILFALLVAYRSKIIKPTENFKLGVFAATAGIALLYVVDLIMSFFSSGISLLNIENTSGISILFSLFVMVIASLNLVIDFDFIEEGAEKGAPKYMEWYGAFGLLVTLIWLYLEILRFLAKMRSR